MNKYIKINIWILFCFNSMLFSQTSKNISEISTSYKNYADIYPEKTKPGAFSWYHNNFLLIMDMPAKVQISFKYNLLYNDQAKNESGLYGAYTNLTLLELFQSKKNWNSNPTIDNDFIPEVFYLFSPRDHIPWFSLQTGFMHQSNGQGGFESYKSVSWNQIYIEPQFHAHFLNGYFFARVRFFIPSDISENPDILDYMGFSEVNLSYKTVFNNSVGFGIDMMMRKGLKSNYGAFSFGVTVGPFFLEHITIPIAIYTQIWTGYGETLLMYNKNYTKYRIGISLPIF